MAIVVLMTTAIIARFSPFYRQDLAGNGQRELTLDGLRGLAALMVTVHHAAVCRIWLRTGEWKSAGATLPQLFGPVGVILFFMLTGYLFWGKARASKGWLDPLKLWRGRLYRIAPLYLFSVVFILVVATIFQGAEWLSLSNWQPLLRLLGLGAWNWQAVGHVYPGEYNANVIWTLRYEWWFYLLLPFIAWLALSGKIFGVPVVVGIFVLAGFWFDLHEPAGLYFICGMLGSELLVHPSVREKMQHPASVLLALAIGVGIYSVSKNQIPETGPSDLLAMVCLPIFLVAAGGNNFFGLLTHPAVRCLGSISFSLYLLHGIVITLVGLILKKAGLDSMSSLQVWLLFTPVAVVITALCAVTYRWVEFPFLSRSHRV